MDDEWHLFRELTEAVGVSGFEHDMREVLTKHLAPYGEMILDHLGSAVVHRRGTGGGPNLLVAAHMDEVGWLVSHVEDCGYLRIRPLGGWWGHVMLAQRVQVMTQRGPVLGVIGSKPPHMLKPKEREEVMPLEEMFIDIGVSSVAEAEQVGVRPGCPVAPVSPLAAMSNPDLMLGKAWDNRAGCAAAIMALAELKDEPVAADLYFGATVQEEVGLRGAQTLTQEIKPDVAIALDVGLSGDIPGVKPRESRSKLGQGVAILLYDGSLVPNPTLRDLLIQTAEAEHIPYQLDSLAGGGTDGGRMQLVDGGVPTVALAVPTRYMHSHNVMVHRKDIEGAAHLVASFVRRLTPRMVEQIRRREPAVPH